MFPYAPVVLAPLNGNPKADILPTLRLFSADLSRVYLADLLSPTLPIDYYPDDPPAEDPGGEFIDDDHLDDEDDFDDLRDDVDAPRRRRPVGLRAPVRRRRAWRSPLPRPPPDPP